MPGEHGERDLRTDGRDLEQQQEERALGGVEKAEELERVLAHVGVDVEIHLGAGIRQPIERVQRDEELIADAAGVDDDLLRRLLEEAPAETRDHRPPSTGAGRRTATGRDERRREPRTECADGRARSRARRPRRATSRSATRSSRTIARCTCSFSARRVPVTASFTVAGAYSAIGDARRGRGQHRDAAHLAEAKRALHVPADEALLEREHVGTPGAAELGERARGSRRASPRAACRGCVVTAPCARCATRAVAPLDDAPAGHRGARDRRRGPAPRLGSPLTSPRHVPLPRRDAPPPAAPRVPLRAQPLDLVLRNVDVRRHLLHVVVILERLEQLQRLLRVAPAQRDACSAAPS